jgi:membrane protein required for colicin V production
VTLFDYAALVVIALSVLISVVRGAVREVMSIASWVASVCLAVYFAPAAATLLPARLASPSLRLGAAFVVILLVSLLLFALIALGLSRLLRKSGLSATDRALGAFFGLARALVILVVITLLAGLTTLPREPAWRDAMLSPPLEALALGVRDYLPQAVASRIGYD